MNKMNDWRKLALLLGGAVLAVPASAQTPTDATQPSSAEESGLGDIVVTAQKRQENLQRVPITVSAFNSDTLTAASVGSARDLSNVVPGLVFNRSVGSGTPFLRGVGQSAGAIGVEPTVALYMDGIYFPTSGAIVASLNSVEQIAVLKGPQGTLFGRNSTGGVIQVTTRTPGNTPVLDADVGYANYDTISGHLYASTPVGDTLRTSVAVGGFNQIEGWGRNITLNKDYYDAKEFTAQSKSVLDVGEDTSLTLNLLYIYTRGYVGNGYGVFPGSLGSDGVTRYLGEYTFAAGQDQDRVARHYIGSLTFEHDFGWAKYKGQVATQKFKDDLIVVQNGLPISPVPILLPLQPAAVIPLHDKAKPTTAEIQLQSPDSSAIRWIVGGYFLRERSGTELDVKPNGVQRFHLSSEQMSRSYAAFGEVSAEILPDTRLTLGGRYTIDKKSMEATRTSAIPALNTTYAAEAARNGWQTKVTWKRPTWRVALDHQLTPDVMLFASYNRGFKSGIFNLIAVNQAAADPEKIDAFEAGTKMMLFDRRLRLNIAGFYYDYGNLQLRTTIPALGIIALLNAGKARIKGVDVDFQAKLTDQLEFTGGFEVLDGKYTSFLQAPCTTPLVNTAGVPIGGLVNFTCDRSDRRMARSPKFTGNFGLQYTLPLASGNELQWNVNDNYNSGYNWEPDGRLKQKSYHSLSAAVKFSMQDGKYYARVWGANLADEKIRALVGYAANDIYAPGAPRTYGITIGCKCLD